MSKRKVGIKIEIETTNDAFTWDGAPDERHRTDEIVRILQHVIQEITETGNTEFPLYDSNGNRVGFMEDITWKVDK